MSKYFVRYQVDNMYKNSKEVEVSLMIEFDKDEINRLEDICKLIPYCISPNQIINISKL